MKKLLSLLLVLSMSILASCGNQNKIVMTPETEKVAETTVEATKKETTTVNIEETKSESNVAADELQQNEIKVSTNNNGGSSMKPVVYFTKDITANSLVKIYEKLGWTPTGKVGVKISTGEPPRSNYLRADLIGDLVKKVNGTIIECNTAYGGDRSLTAMHKQVAKDHGYTDIAEVDIMDEEGDMDIPVNGGTRLSKLITGNHLTKYGSVIVLSHFKGHQKAG